MPPPICAEERGWLWGLGAVTFLLAFGNLAAPLVEPTEARYALIPAEMLASGLWFSPTLFGEAYQDKPPLLYWLVMASYSLLGVSDWAARIPACCCAMATPWVAWAWLRAAIGPRAGLLAAWVLCLSPRVMYYMGMLAMDGLVGLATVSILGSLHLAVTTHRWRWPFLALATLAVIAGILAKGPVVLVGTVPTAFIAVALSGKWNSAMHLGLWLVFAIIGSGACFWLLDSASPGFSQAFLLRHNVERFASPFDHTGPWWYHLPGFAIALLPWGPIALWTWWKSQKPSPCPDDSSAFVWLAFSFAIGIVFFSAAGSKRPSYGTVFLPQACMLMGLFLDRCLPTGWAALSNPRSDLGTALAWIFIPGLAGIGWAGWLLGWSSWGWIPPLALCSLAGTWAVWRHGCRCHIGLALASVTMAFGHVVLLWGHHDTFSPRRGLAWLCRHQPNSVLACFPHPFESVEFYANGMPVMHFNETQTHELALFLHQNPQAVLVAKGNKLPAPLLAELGVQPVPATPYKSTPWLMRLPKMD